MAILNTFGVKINESVLDWSGLGMYSLSQSPALRHLTLGGEGSYGYRIA